MSAAAVHLPALQVALPLLTAPLAVLLRPGRLAWAAALAASLCAFGIAVALTGQVQAAGTLRYAVGAWPPPYGIELVVDSLTVLLLLAVTGASSAGLLIAGPHLDAELAEARQPAFYTAWLLALAGLSGICVSGDAFNIFVFMEISSLSMYVLIAGGSDRQALPAVFKYLVMGTIGATFYLIGVGLIYMMTGTLNLADMAARLDTAPDPRPLLAAGGFITVGLALKAAVFPLHAWLPNAYTYAPHAVTTFIAACATKVSLYVLLRFDFLVFQGNLSGHAAQFVAFALPLAVLAMLVASLIAVREQHLKRMLAYSSVAQIGYMLFGAGMLSAAGLTAATVHFFNHALAKGTLFIALACLAARGVTLSVAGVAGVARGMPLTMAGFTLAGLSLIGLPGTAGFISKWHFVTAALELGMPGLLLVAALLVSSILAVLYIGKVVESAWFAPPQGQPAAAAGEAPVWLLAVLWLGVALNLYFGLQPALPLSLAAGAAAALQP